MRDKLAGWQVVARANGFQVRMLVVSPKTRRGRWERVYVRIEPVGERPAEVTHSLAYPRRADIVFRRPVHGRSGARFVRS